MQTLRILRDTCSSEHRAPDGGVKFRAGLVVPVEPGNVDEVTARRWIRNRVAEEFDGLPGDLVTPEERAASPVDFDAEIARLQRLKDAALARAREPAATLPADPDRAIGTTPYRDRGEPHPLAAYDLPDAQRAALESAGFTRPDIIERATDEELLEVHGVGEGTLRRLGRTPR